MSKPGDSKEMEQHRVKEIIGIADSKMHKLLGKGSAAGSDVLELKKTFWEDVTVNLDEPDDVIETFTSIKQQAELLSERERTKSQLDRQLSTLAKIKNSPYFGRIDFHEEGEKEEDVIYLGISSLMDEEDENFLVYDWRAPISSMYYDYAPGPAHYNTPEGTIEGEMLLKRQFIIKGGKIEGMFDTGLTIGDQLLQEVLGNKASTQMKSIVATIQKEQNEIIRNENSKVLIVQGVAGSGKTSAALQRVAYLLYRHRGTLQADNIMLFSPNSLFNSYVSTVLPELGEENMSQATYQEYITRSLGRELGVEDPFDQLESILSEENTPEKEMRKKAIRFKSDTGFVEMIKSYTGKLSVEGLQFEDLRFRGETLFTHEEISHYFYSLDHSISIPNRMQLTKDWLLQELRKIQKAERKKEWVEEEIQLLDKVDYLEAFKKAQQKQNKNGENFDEFEQEQKFLENMVVNKRFKGLKSRVKNLKFLDVFATYEQLFCKDHVLGDSLYPENWDAVCKITAANLSKEKIPYEDATPYLYLQHLLEGRKQDTGIRHVFIDEAQDYSPFQFAYIKELFPYSRLTLLGDVNQAVYTHSIGATTLYHGHEEEAKTIVLTKSYRSSRPIVEFTRSFISGGDLVEPFNREGRLPAVIFEEDREALHAKIAETVNRQLKEAHKSISIICRTAKESKEAFEGLKELLPDVRLIEKGTLSYEKGVTIIPAYLAKGIEFDTVIIYDASAYDHESDRTIFYTACTRAMHELDILYTGRKNDFILEVDPKLYTTK
ncbi:MULTISPECIES: RNA polymerase recycling motor HelD [Bacillus]|uniref:RNA polymerase recycling motor HelD n=1 Tax=Bacillus TaxID=1386 RepID=UPI000C75EB2E|nr:MULTISPECIES: RNA polymerase recycling motor HelD [Bacillus]MCP1158311.1 UvrD-helicase domain-containing protein [Bacillus infantis]PLR74363.1 helicase [Bacillus sp. UMB0728]